MDSRRYVEVLICCCNATMNSSDRIGVCCMVFTFEKKEKILFEVLLQTKKKTSMYTLPPSLLGFHYTLRLTLPCCAALLLSLHFALYTLLVVESLVPLLAHNSHTPACVNDCLVTMVFSLLFNY